MHVFINEDQDRATLEFTEVKLHDDFKKWLGDNGVQAKEPLNDGLSEAGSDGDTYLTVALSQLKALKTAKAAEFLGWERKMGVESLTAKGQAVGVA